MSKLQAALESASQGFKVFPLQIGGKLPLIPDFPNMATSDPEQIRKWWLSPVIELEQDYNIGISTSSFGEDEALLVVDVDNKGKKNGSESVLDLEMRGYPFPETYTQSTPTGGYHYVYRVAKAVKQGVSKVGDGLDIRSRGGYIVGRGSEINGKLYTANTLLPAVSPEWLVLACEIAPAKEKKKKVDTSKVNQKRALKQALEFLKALPNIDEGSRNHQAYVAACRIKDMGVDEQACVALMIESFKCEPPLGDDEFTHVVSSAYKYGINAPGALAPEVVFATSDALDNDAPNSPHPFDKLNKEFAFVVAGGGSHILWETKDAEGNFYVDHLSIQAFHQMKASEMIMIGGKEVALTRLWMTSPRRRSYQGLCFMPGGESPKDFYNLWRGFSVVPLAVGENPNDKQKRALDMFLDHARKNVCRDDEALFHWLIGYFAHLVQRPADKPLVALVFRGGKGVGKNALVERVGSLIKNNFKVTADRRYLLGNFNSHLERSLLFVLDEAFWSGDKQAEGVLKNLITGKMHVIEHKGKEPYEVRNCTRVVIIGNEDWLVPASNDERRFAVFDVGDARKQDNAFFQKMRELMESGGYAYLLRYLLDYNLDDIDVNKAPTTSALLEQKLESLSPFHTWWFECLKEERIVGSDFGNSWPEQIDRERLRSAFKRYIKERQILSRTPAETVAAKLLRQFAPAMTTVRLQSDDERRWAYVIPGIAECRKSWEIFLGQSIRWE